jgi:hypothetical protein
MHATPGANVHVEVFVSFAFKASFARCVDTEVPSSNHSLSVTHIISSACSSSAVTPPSEHSPALFRHLKVQQHSTSSRQRSITQKPDALLSMKGESLTLVNSSTTVITVVESQPLVLAPAFAVSSPEREKPPRLVQQHSSESDEKLAELERKGGVAQVAESLRWVQKHPVLAAVIWVFGKVVPHDLGAASTARSESEPCISSGSAAADDAQTSSGEKKTSSRRLSWNDERDGTLAEYFEVCTS